MKSKGQPSSTLADPARAGTPTEARPPERVAAGRRFGPEIVRFDQVGLTYGGAARRTEALRGFSMTLAEGERVALVGPSGCGKSTVLSLIAGLIEASAGGVTVSREVALMPQRDLLVPWRTALRNAALALEAQGAGRDEAVTRARPLFARFGLGGFEDSRTWELSGGMRQRVAFLRTILTGRPLLALDEPFGALDAITRGEMHEWLEQALAAEPRTMLLVTHDIEEALSLAGRVLLMSRRPGHVAAEIAVDRPAGLSRAQWTTSREFSILKSQALAVLR